MECGWSMGARGGIMNHSPQTTTGSEVIATVRIATQGAPRPSGTFAVPSRVGVPEATSPGR